MNHKRFFTFSFFLYFAFISLNAAGSLNTEPLLVKYSKTWKVSNYGMKTDDPLKSISEIWTTIKSISLKDKSTHQQALDLLVIMLPIWNEEFIKLSKEYDSLPPTYINIEVEGVFASGVAPESIKDSRVRETYTEALIKDGLISKKKEVIAKSIQSYNYILTDIDVSCTNTNKFKNEITKVEALIQNYMKQSKIF
jgi:hypothetical protein